MKLLNHPIPAIGLWRLMDWQLDSLAVLRWTHQVLDLGSHVFDLADIYGDYAVEAHFGSALALEPALRKRLFLISKCGIKLVSPGRPQHRLKSYDTSHAHVTASVEASLCNLHTDHLDLLLIHRPDPLINADEVAEAFSALKQAGKVLHFGVSNFSTVQFDLLASRLSFPLITNQVELSVLQPAALYDGTLDQCQRLRVSPMAWSPFGGGKLFYGQGQQEQRVRAALEKVGAEHGDWTLDQTALAWILTHPSRIVPVLGTRSLDNIREALNVADSKLTREQWFSILEAVHGHEVP